MKDSEITNHSLKSIGIAIWLLVVLTFCILFTTCAQMSIEDDARARMQEVYNRPTGY